MFRLELTQCQLILYPLRAEQSCTYTARRWRRPAERAYYRSTCIPSLEGLGVLMQHQLGMTTVRML